MPRAQKLDDKWPKVMRDALNKARYGWSKWGGSNQGLVSEELTSTWFCQACQEEQTNELPPFMYEHSEREFIRICSKCQNIRLMHNIENKQLDILCALVRKKHDIWE